MDLNETVNKLASEDVAATAPREGLLFYALAIALEPWRFDEDAIDAVLLPLLEERGCIGCGIEPVDDDLVIKTQVYLDRPPAEEHQALASDLQEVLPGDYKVTTSWAKVAKYDEEHTSEIV
jgi:hypothetical protein